jgi:hypothetical protein
VGVKIPRLRSQADRTRAPEAAGDEASITIPLGLGDERVRAPLDHEHARVD